jgi:tetratricopeptide (TPR) repeat protein
MALRGITSVCALLLLTALALCAQELPAAPQPQPNAGQQQPQHSPPDSSSSKHTPADQQPTADDSTNQQNTDKKQPSRLKRVIDRAKPNCANVEGRQTCWDKDGKEKEEAQSRAPQNQPAPRSDPPAGQSSSRETQVDLSPPADDMTHEGADVTGVTEFHAYDPHKAAKDVEVGDFYYKRENYKAAESRYAEALDWKPNDAIATYKLAQSQEKLGKKDDALKNYQAYLKILPQGELSAEAKSSIARLGK